MKSHWKRKLMSSHWFHYVVTFILLLYVAYHHGWISIHIKLPRRNIPHYDKNPNYDRVLLNTSELMPISNVTTDKRIFFLELSGKGGLDSREACSVESAAKANPNWRIEVIFLGPLQGVFLSGKLFEALNKTSNIIFSAVSFIELYRGTPLEEQLTTNMTKADLKSVFRDLSDKLRYIILYKYGGVYLDLDVVVVKSFDTLPKNWVAKQSLWELGEGAMGLSNDDLGRMIANQTIDTFLSRRNALVKFISSEGLLRSALTKICDTPQVNKMNEDTCNGLCNVIIPGLELFDSVYFYPVPWKSAGNYRKPVRRGVGLSLGDTYTAYAHHMWSDHDTERTVPETSRYAALARLFCPKVYDLYGDAFGV